MMKLVPFLMLLLFVRTQAFNLDLFADKIIDVIADEVARNAADESIKDDNNDKLTASQLEDDSEETDKSIWAIDLKAHTEEMAKKMGLGISGGDELLTPIQMAAIRRARKNGVGKRTAGTQHAFRLWPKGTNGRVRIPFTVDIGAWWGPRWETKTNIKKTIKKLKKNTCVDWVERNGEKDYVSIQDDKKGCWSYIGKIGGKQVLNQGRGCASEQATDHEMMHAMGFFHAQNRPDRDKYIRINWDNIMEGKEINFEPQPFAKTYGLPFDWYTVMLYDSKEFADPKDAYSMNGKVAGHVNFKDNPRYSAQDYVAINLAYGCCSAKYKCSV